MLTTALWLVVQWTMALLAGWKNSKSLNKLLGRERFFSMTKNLTFYHCISAIPCLRSGLAPAITLGFSIKFPPALQTMEC